MGVNMTVYGSNFGFTPDWRAPEVLATIKANLLGTYETVTGVTRENIVNAASIRDLFRYYRLLLLLAEGEVAALAEAPDSRWRPVDKLLRAAQAFTVPGSWLAINFENSQDVLFVVSAGVVSEYPFDSGALMPPPGDPRPYHKRITATVRARSGLTGLMPCYAGHKWRYQP